ncbi:30S ribosomal protein S2 [Candidatus Gracilibacteria bacterium]|nr:30S ribosomal protein S2 [Candidatus Gracilibacteria bacterium]
MAADVKTLFENLVHVGHRSERWNPKMKKYLYTKVNGVMVFDLEQTAVKFEKALNFLKAVKLQNKKVLFVGTKPQAALQIQKLVAPKGHYYVDKKWTPGLLTNFGELRKRIDYYLNLKQQFESGDINKYTKKEVAKFKKDLEKLHASYGGVAEMRKKADVVIVLDAVTDRIAVDEAKNAGLAVLAVCDANANPEGVDYLIPGNDDALKSVAFLLESMVQSLD